MHKGWMMVAFGLMLAPLSRAGVSHVVNDFDGDGRTDAGWFDAKAGRWTLRTSGGGVWSSNAVQKIAFGFKGTVPVPGDFNGDGLADLCLYDPQASRWYLRGTNIPETNFVFGVPGDLPVSGDFDGDHRADLGVYDPAHGQWTLRLATGGVRSVSLGTPGRVPVVADFDGDGRDDVGTYFAPNGSWHLSQSTSGLLQKTHGFPNTYPVVGDFDGDGRADLGVVDQPIETGGRGRPRPYLLQTTRGATNDILHGLSQRAGQFGIGDYDGDGRFDFLSDEQVDYGVFSKIENLNDPTFIDLPLVTNRYPGAPLGGSVPVLDNVRGWQTPGDGSYGLALTPWICSMKLANGRTLKLELGNGSSGTVTLKDWSNASATAYLGLLGDAPNFHLASSGTTATGPMTFIGLSNGYSLIPLLYLGGYSSLNVLMQQVTGTYRDQAGTQTATVTRYQLTLFLAGAL